MQVPNATWTAVRPLQMMMMMMMVGSSRGLPGIIYSLILGHARISRGRSKFVWGLTWTIHGRDGSQQGRCTVIK
eukprot:6122228-Karenia_brevis.AAC.1